MTNDIEKQAETFDLDAGIVTYDYLLLKKRASALPSAIVRGELASLPENAKPEHKLLFRYVQLKKEAEKELELDFPLPKAESFSLDNVLLNASKEHLASLCQERALDYLGTLDKIEAFKRAKQDVEKKRASENIALASFNAAFKECVAYNTSVFSFTYLDDLASFVRTSFRSELQKTVDLSDFIMLLKLASVRENLVDEHNLAFLAKETQVHTITHYARSLPVWDGVTRFDYLCNNVLKLDKEHDLYPLWAEMLKRWMKATVTRWLEPGYKNDLCLVLISDQGQRKDTFWSRLVPTDSLISTQSRLTEKDDVMESHSGGLVILSELSSIYRKADQETLKGHIQKQHDKIRPPYGKTVLHLPRVFSYCGTSNDNNILIDPTGNRRFLPLPLESGFEIDVDWVDEHRDQLWAETIASEWKSWFSEAELIQANIRHTHEVAEIEALVYLFRRDEFEDLQNGFGFKGVEFVPGYNAGIEHRARITDRKPVLLTGNTIWLAVAQARNLIEHMGPWETKHGHLVTKWMTALGFKQIVKKHLGKTVRVWTLSNNNKLTEALGFRQDN